jgi:metal-responsive CopG/Arc/MetJ family transcriptional regulator
MRTTIRLDDHLLKEAEEVAAATNRTLSELVEDALRETLARRQAGRNRSRVVLTTFKGSGLRPGVDLDCSDSLHDLMDRST